MQAEQCDCRTFINNNHPNERLQHLGNKPHTLVALMMHDRLIAATGRALARTRARARRLLLALGLVGPPKQRTARLARFEAEVAVLVRQIREHARADDACERVSGKVERLEGVEGEYERWDVGCGRRLLGECIRGNPSERTRSREDSPVRRSVEQV